MTGPVKNDTVFLAVTPEGIEYTLYPAGLCARFCAYGLDTLFQWILLFVFFIVYFFVMGAAGGFWIFLLVRFGLDWFYHVFFDLFFNGQSPGKRILGIRVVLNDGSPVNGGASFIRNLLRFVDGFIGLYLIAFLSSVISSAFRRPGDWAAGTLVIYTWQSQIPQQTHKMEWLSELPLILPPRALSFEEKQGILMFARRYPLLGPARADEIAGPLAVSLQRHENTTSRRTLHRPSDYLLCIARSFAGEI
ncbi:MAG: RDD family protein [Treponema sp.]|jgi:uncharacterized RDD family membrane protein YckC|nr:RDD family protein [Treponema sp.]